MSPDCSPLKDSSEVVLIKIIQARFLPLLQQSAQGSFIHRRDFYAAACRQFRLDRGSIQSILKILEEEGFITQDARGIRVLRKEEAQEHG